MVHWILWRLILRCRQFNRHAAVDTLIQIPHFEFAATPPLTNWNLPTYFYCLIARVLSDYVRFRFIIIRARISALVYSSVSQTRFQYPLSSIQILLQLGEI